MAWTVVDAEAVRWILSLRIPTQEKFGSRKSKGVTLAAALPSGFPQYIKILHEISEDLSIADRHVTWDEWDRAQPVPADQSDDEARLEGILSQSTLARANPEGEYPSRRIRWSELCERYGLQYHAELTCNSFSRKFPKHSWPRYLVGPAEGSLTSDEFLALLQCIVESGGDEEVYMYWELSRLCRGEDACCIKGRLLDEDVPWPAGLSFTPEYIWPESRQWIVHTDYDLTFTLVAATEALGRRLLSSPVLEALAIPFEMRIDDKSDRVNL